MTSSIAEDKKPVGAYVERIETQNTGGGRMIDYVFLKNGTAIGVSDECVCRCTDPLTLDTDYDKVIHYGIIYLPDTEKWNNQESAGIGCYIERILTADSGEKHNEGEPIKARIQHDLIYLGNKLVLCVSDEAVELYRPTDLFNGDIHWPEAGRINLLSSPEPDDSPSNH